MAHVVNGDCTCCCSCMDECPVSAISEKGGKAWIDPDICIDCGACAEVCPVEAISAE
ncbi:MAG: 4Fe-4S binding protein [Mucispirillum sp.]|nr:4Fe-4S binding protein [Mucispirillum sp.]